MSADGLQPGSVTAGPTAAGRWDVEAIRRQFPILARTVYDRPLVYLDNAATTQKPTAVLDALQNYYTAINSNVHRGVHKLASDATEAFEGARATVAGFVGAADTAECVFTRGTTESINLVASGLAQGELGAGDRVLVSEMEHHSNIVPWQLACERSGAELVAIPVTDSGELDLERYRALLDERVKVVAVTWISNALGTINPIAEMVADARSRCGAVFVVDGAQAAAHLTIDVKAVDCDFLALSGHKMFGPMGIGALYGKAELLAKLAPYQGGGEMITSVRFSGSTYADPPHRFEAGTPDVAGAIGLAKAIEWLTELDREALRAHEDELLRYGTERLTSIEGLTLMGTASAKTAILAFQVDGAHPYDLAQILDHEGIAIRTGHHCAEPLHQRFGLTSSARASLALYNRADELDALAAGIERARTMLA